MSAARQPRPSLHRRPASGPRTTKAHCPRVDREPRRIVGALNLGKTGGGVNPRIPTLEKTPGWHARAGLATHATRNPLASGLGRVVEHLRHSCRRLGSRVPHSIVDLQAALARPRLIALVWTANPDASSGRSILGKQAVVSILEFPHWKRLQGGMRAPAWPRTGIGNGAPG